MMSVEFLKVDVEKNKHCAEFFTIYVEFSLRFEEFSVECGFFDV